MLGQKGIPATYGGIERHVEELATRLVERGHEVTVYCRPYYTKIRGDYRGVRLAVLPSVRTKHLDTATHCALSMPDILARNYDIVHFHALGPSMFAGLPKLRGAKTAVTVHGLDWQREKWGSSRGRFSSGASTRRSTSRTRPLSFRRRSASTSGRARRDRDVHPERDRAAARARGLEDPADGHRARELRAVRRAARAGEGLPLPARGVQEDQPGHRASSSRAAPASRPSTWTGSTPWARTRRASSDTCTATFSTSCTRTPALVLPSDIEGLPIALLEAMSFGNCCLTSDIRRTSRSSGTGRHVQEGRRGRPRREARGAPGASREVPEPRRPREAARPRDVRLGRCDAPHRGHLLLHAEGVQVWTPGHRVREGPVDVARRLTSGER